MPSTKLLREFHLELIKEAQEEKEGSAKRENLLLLCKLIRAYGEGKLDKITFKVDARYDDSKL